MPSTVIRSFRYDAAHRELLIAFRSGRRYIYTDVPPEEFVAMKSAFSKGQYFNAHIRDRFQFKRPEQ
jgi:hypothetical protein